MAGAGTEQLERMGRDQIRLEAHGDIKVTLEFIQSLWHHSDETKMDPGRLDDRLTMSFLEVGTARRYRIGCQ